MQRGFQCSTAVSKVAHSSWAKYGTLDVYAYRYTYMCMDAYASVGGGVYRGCLSIHMDVNARTYVIVCTQY